MAKGRMINRSIAIDPKFNSLSMEAQWLYMRMLPFMDDYGRVTGNLFELKYQIIPSCEQSTDWVNRILISLVYNGLILYEENVCVQFIGFEKNQKIGHRRAESKYADIVKDRPKEKESFGKVLKGTNNIIKDNIIKENKTKVNKSKPRDLQEVIDYFKTKKVPDVDKNAEKFYQHYEASGWYRGKTKIKNWKMCLSSWNFKEEQKIINKPSFESTFQKTPTGLYKAYCGKCGKREMPNDKWQLKEGSNCCRVDYVPSM